MDAQVRELELEQYVRSAGRKALGALAALFVALAIAGTMFQQDLMQAAAWTERTIGVVGLGGFVFLADGFTLPLPPDLALIVVANSPRRADWFWIVPLLGSVSALAGSLGFFIGTQLSRSRWVLLLCAGLKRRHAAALSRYGSIAIAIAALTPVPFSITCWAAGALGMPFRTFIIPCLLRIPRFVVYYVVLANATHVSAWLGALLGN